MFSERRYLSRRSSAPPPPRAPYRPRHGVVNRNYATVEAHALSLRSVNGSWESIERKYLENLKHATRP
jgi:hypothetical protein